jgi:hypothetical protein
MKNADHSFLLGRRRGRDVNEEDFQDQRGLKIGAHSGEETSDT